VILGALFRQLDVLQYIDRSTRETDEVTRIQYLSLQMEMIWRYLIKFVVPAPLAFWYDLQVPASFFNGKTLILALGHVALLSLALVFLRRSPVIAFSVLFYYCAHLVESSVIPITHAGFEHRTYLPNVGLCLLFAWVCVQILARRLDKNIVAGLLLIVVVVLGGLTWARNNAWRDQIAMYRHEIDVNPDNFGIYNTLGEIYLRQGRPLMALEVYDQAAPLYERNIARGSYDEVSYLSNFVLALEQTANYERAITILEGVDPAGITPGQQSLFLSRRGIIHARTNQFDQAETAFQQALAQNPANLDALNNYAKVLLVVDRPDEALGLFQRALVVDPQNEETRIGLNYLNGLGYGDGAP